MERFLDNGSERFQVGKAETEDRLATIPSYISRMVQSHARRPHVSIFCWEHSDKHLVTLICPKGVLLVMIFIKRVEAARERAVRSLFTQAGITPIQDELTGETGDESRFLLYPLPALPGQASSLIQQLLRKGYGINDDTEIEITYSQKNAA